MTGAAPPRPGPAWPWRQIHEPVAGLCRRLLATGSARPMSTGAQPRRADPDPDHTPEPPVPGETP